ncbi:hypothetical protein ACFOZ7_21655 [Natribaculum luteum]|uniref:Uncharacterized protein n=1 Tax=Natribaculum luteum TaxID=1586232 RepID=A0ABD5P608_9EURY|nr:hypothetical protein [Natribaculum luteum]
MAIEANIVDIPPHCEYQGTIYEQRVVLQAASVELGCFDPDMHASESIIGERCEIDFYPALPTAVERAVETDVGIKPNPDEPQDYTDHQFSGHVVSVSSGWPKSVELDVDVVGESLELDPIALDTSGDGIRDNETVDINYRVFQEDNETKLHAWVIYAEHHPARIDTTGDGLTDREQLEGWEIETIPMIPPHS